MVIHKNTRTFNTRLMSLGLIFVFGVPQGTELVTHEMNTCHEVNFILKSFKFQHTNTTQQIVMEGCDNSLS